MPSRCRYEIFPVCAPSYAQTRALKNLTDLLEADLIDLDYQHWNWMNWGIWLTENGLDASRAHRAFQSNSYPAVIAAARDGWGVALGWRHFVDDDLAAGRLVRPLPEAVPTAFGYHLARRITGQDGHVAKLFSDWLLSHQSRRNRDLP